MENAFPPMCDQLKARAMARLKPDPKATGIRRIGLPVVAFAWLLFFAVGGYALFTFGGPHHMIVGGGKSHDALASVEAGSNGGEREAALLAATKRYLETHPEAPQAMRDGRELAPLDFLNQDLAAHQQKFRVRKVSGNRAELYEIS